MTADPQALVALKPCPCCGSDSIIPPPKHWPEGCVYCRSCGLRANSPEAWNTRTPPTPSADAEALARLAWHEWSAESEWFQPLRLNDVEGAFAAGYHAALKDTPNDR